MLNQKIIRSQMNMEGRKGHKELKTREDWMKNKESKSQSRGASRAPEPREVWWLSNFPAGCPSSCPSTATHAMQPMARAHHRALDRLTCAVRPQHPNHLASARRESRLWVRNSRDGISFQIYVFLTSFRTLFSYYSNFSMVGGNFSPVLFSSQRLESLVFIVQFVSFLRLLDYSFECLTCDRILLIQFLILIQVFFQFYDYIS